MDIKQDEAHFNYAHIPVKITNEKYDKVLKELTELINRNSLENGSNTPDFILAEYMLNSLFAYEAAANNRTNWYGGQSEDAVLSGEQCPNVPVDRQVMDLKGDNLLPECSNETPS